MKKLFSKYKWLGILLGVLLVVAGILIIVLSAVNVGSLNTIISITAAVILFLIGGSLLLSSLLTSIDSIFESSIFYGAVYITIGILLLVNLNLLPDMIISVMGIALIAYGTALFIKSLALAIRKSKKKGLIALGIVVGLLAITGGILAIVYSSTVQMIIYIGLGAAILFAGILQIISVAKTK